MKTIVILFLLASAVSAQTWTKTEAKDSFTGDAVARYSIEGKFLTAPARGKYERPVYLLSCSKGKLISEAIATGAAVDLIEPEGTAIKFRLNDGDPKEEAWSVTSDLTVMLPRHTFLSPSIRKLLVSASEYEAGDFVMEFDFPASEDEVTGQCGLK